MKLIHTIFFLIISYSAYPQVQELFRNEAALHHFSGVVSIKHGDHIQFQSAFGHARENQPNTIQTRFDIGSVSKQFTAAAILHLVKDGKIELDEYINNYLGIYSSDKWEKVTVHHLLTHTSGIPSLYQTEQGLEIFFPEESEITLRELINRFEIGELLNKPGKEFNYSNSGYILLAAILEEVSMESYYQFMENHIFEKYSLINTSFGREGEVADPYYGYLPTHKKKAPVYHPSWLIGAGGIYSTAQDLSKWVQIINSDQFLNEELRSLFLRSHTDTNYGYGWQFSRGGIIQHDGGNAGFISFLSFKPETGEHHIILTNQSFEDKKDFGKSSDKVRSLSNQIWKWRNNDELKIPPKRISYEVDSAVYRLADGRIISINQTNDAVEVSISDGSPLRIITDKKLNGENENEKKLLSIAAHLEKSQFWKFASYCNWEMKIVAYTGLMRIGFNQMKDQVGGLKELIAYSVDERKGIIRMIGNDSVLDLIAYFDEEGKLYGLFEHGNYPLKGPKKINAYTVEGNKLFMDGFPTGELSGILEFENDSLKIIQSERSVSSVRIN